MRPIEEVAGEIVVVPQWQRLEFMEIGEIGYMAMVCAFPIHRHALGIWKIIGCS